MRAGPSKVRLIDELSLGLQLDHRLDYVIDLPPGVSMSSTTCVQRVEACGPELAVVFDPGRLFLEPA
jgi:hypothetical protein